MRKEGVSAKTDQLASDLMGDAFDLLAEGPMNQVLLVVEDSASSVVSYSFADDGMEALLGGAYKKVRQLKDDGGSSEDGLGEPRRYALCYVGAVANEEGLFEEALLLEFGEVGYTAYSAFSFIDKVGEGDEFCFSEPSPAGEVEALL